MIYEVSFDLEADASEPSKHTRVGNARLGGRTSFFSTHCFVEVQENQQNEMITETTT